MPEPTYRSFETARDAALVLRGFGYLSLFASVAYLLFSILGGYGPLSWFYYYFGPATLLLASIMLPIGYRFARTAENLRSELGINLKR